MMKKLFYFNRKKFKLISSLFILFLFYKTINLFEAPKTHHTFSKDDDTRGAQDGHVRDKAAFKKEIFEKLLDESNHKEPDLQIAENTDAINEENVQIIKPLHQSYKLYSHSVRTCPDYEEYSKVPHFLAVDDFTDPDILPYQRPPDNCRTFYSDSVERVIQFMTENLKSSKLARLFENCFPNTLDTTILYHYDDTIHDPPQERWQEKLSHRNAFPETFVITGDINAEWLRDSAWQLSVYQPLIKYDAKLKNLIKGAINTQAQLLANHPYCNAFKPFAHMKIRDHAGHIDQVSPRPDWRRVFECKYEVDSIASFLTISRQYYENSEGDTSFINIDWFLALTQLLAVVRRESISTYEKYSHSVNPFLFTFQRDTNSGSETRPLAGTGNPVNYDTNLIKSAFRPSDDVTIFQYFVPGNAFLATELTKMAIILEKHKYELESVYMNTKTAYKTNSYKLADIIEDLESYGNSIKEGIYKHAVVKDKRFGGDVLSFEVDGFGSRLMMDDANLPSLLSLPDLGFISKDDTLYKNTRKMVLSPLGNPYAKPDNLYFPGIGSPHTGIHSVWPMSLTTAIRTSSDDKEIMAYLKLLMDNTNGLGLMHESINAYKPYGKEYTRPWFAWANSEFAKTVLYLAKNKPNLIFHKNVKFSLDHILLS